MDINQIKDYIEDSDPQKRMKAITELRHQDTETSVPLLKAKINDPEFLVRSFVAMGFGRKQNAESFAALLEMMKLDKDPNVRAEAANSLSLFGEVAAPHLSLMFEQEDHWLIRRSILAALAELDCPEELLQAALLGLEGTDETVKESSVDCLGQLANTNKADMALDKLLSLSKCDRWRIRQRTAKALGKFKNEKAKATLNKLKEDSHHRVVAAVLESMV